MASCAPVRSQIIVPAVVQLPGRRGAQWRSAIDIVNPGSESATVSITIEPRDLGPAEGVEWVEILPPGGGLRLDPALEQVFGFEGAATLRLVSQGASIIASGKTYSSGSAGTYGQLAPGYADHEVIAGGDEARMIGLRHDSGHRTNIGLVNTGEGELDLELTVLSRDGLVLGSRLINLEKRQSVQLNGGMVAIAGSQLDLATVTVRGLTSGSQFLAFASVIDKLSGDPYMVTPAVSAEAGERLWLPGVARQPGASGSDWRTSLDLHNPGAEATILRVTFVPWLGLPMTLPLELEANASVRIDDVLVDLWGASGGGTLAVDVLLGRCMAGARTFHQGFDGDWGQLIPARMHRDVIGSPETIYLLQLADVEGVSRTNIGLVNTGSPTEARVRLFTLDGEYLGERSFDLAEGESTQVNGILRQVAEADVPESYAIVTGGGIIAYASVIDERTNDPVMVMGVRETAGK